MGDFREAFKDAPISNHLITPLDFTSTKKLPETHAWIETLSNEPTNNNPLSTKDEEQTTSIPMINLKDPNVIEQIFEACKDWGVFQISNHGIPEQLLEEVEVKAKELFNLPLEQKMKVVRAPGGAIGYGVPRIAPFFDKLMWCEGFTMMGDSSVEHAKQLWPNDYTKFCDVMNDYQTKVTRLALKLMGLILKSLNIPEQDMYWLKQEPAQNPENLSTAIHLNSYPPCPDPARSMGIAPHTDTLLFTILHQTGNGLQVFKDGPGWVSVNSVPGTLVVNVGDILHIISNGRFPSVLHRAIVNNEKQRISIIYFFGPPLDFDVSPFVDYPGCEGPYYKSMKAKEYVSLKAKHLTSLSHIKIGN